MMRKSRSTIIGLFSAVQIISLSGLRSTQRDQAVTISKRWQRHALGPERRYRGCHEPTDGVK